MASQPDYHLLQPSADGQLLQPGAATRPSTGTQARSPRNTPNAPNIKRRPVPSTNGGPALQLRTISQSQANLTASHNGSRSPSGSTGDKDTPGHYLRQAGWWATVLGDTWTLEFAAGFVAFAALMSIAGILWSYDDKPEPAMVKGITLNAVISFLATISRSAIMLCVGTVLSQGKWLWSTKSRSLIDLQFLDDASRGPWGSTQLLFRYKGGPTSCIAALLTVLVLAFDPFVQQLLTVQPRTIAEAGSGIAINAARNFNGNNADMGYAETSAQIAAAMLEDLEPHEFLALPPNQRRHNKRSQPTPQPASSPLIAACPSGDCFWQPYYALDICNQCRNTTSELIVRSSSPHLNDALSYIMGQAVNKSESTVILNFTWELIPERGAGWQVPSSLFAKPGITVDFTTPYTTMVRKVVWPLNFELDANLSFTSWEGGRFAGLDDPVTAFAFAEFSLGGNGLPVLNKSLECALTYCVKEFNRSVSQGQLLSNILSEQYGNTTGHSQSDLTWSTTLNRTRYPVQDPGSEFNGFGTGIATLMSFLLGSATHTYPAQLPGLNGLLAQAQTSNVNFGDYNSTYADSWEGIDWTDNFGTVVNNTNAMMSDILQQYGNDTIVGDNAVTKNFIVVRWEWITLPATVVLFGLGILAFTAWQTKSLRMPKWSSSLLPLLYRYVEIESQHARAVTQTTVPANLSAGGTPAGGTKGSEHSNLLSRFEIAAEETVVRLQRETFVPGIWQLRSSYLGFECEQAWWHRLWHRLKWW